MIGVQIELASGEAQSMVRSWQAACSCGTQRSGAKPSALSCGCAIGNNKEQ